MKSYCLRAILLVLVFLAAACGRREKVDREMVNKLLLILEEEAPPMIHGQELARVSEALPQYERVLQDYLLFGEKYPVRDGLGIMYGKWRHEDEAIFILREGLKPGQVKTTNMRRLVFYSALARDGDTFDKCWDLFAETTPAVSRAAFASLTRGDIREGLAKGIQALKAQDAIPQRILFPPSSLSMIVQYRFQYRDIFARILVKNAADSRLHEFAEKIFDPQLSDFLQAAPWRNFLARYAVERHDFHHTILIEDLASTMGSAAEYYAKVGDDVKKAEWLKRIAELSAAMRPNNRRQAEWLDFLAQRASSTAAVR